jgi:RNA polymerase sigma-70 factor (ECF subfamily)
VRIPPAAGVADQSGTPEPSGRVRASRRDPADDQLALRVAAGDVDGLDAIYERLGRPAFALARRICGDDGIAEDVVQEVFLAFWRNPGRFDPERGGFATWLLTLVHHKSVDAVRRETTIRRRTVPAAEDGQEWSIEPGPGADVAALGSVVADKVRDALRTLPAEQRQAVALAYYGGYTQREVATLTGVPLGTVKSRMFTALGRLRGLLGPAVDEFAGGAW